MHWRWWHELPAFVLLRPVLLSPGLKGPLYHLTFIICLKAGTIPRRHQHRPQTNWPAHCSLFYTEQRQTCSYQRKYIFSQYIPHLIHAKATEASCISGFDTVYCVCTPVAHQVPMLILPDFRKKVCIVIRTAGLWEIGQDGQPDSKNE